jgi:hypothetical protein
MERIKISEESMFNQFKKKNFEKINTNKIKFLISYGEELQNIQIKIDQVRSIITKENGNIDDLIKDLELCLPSGNNNKNLCQIFFKSKTFLDLIELINIDNNKHLTKIIVFIEKLLKGNKHASKYLGKNMEFIRRIFILMKTNVK